MTAAQYSEARYRQIVESTEEGIWMIDVAAATTFVNPKMARMLGYTVEEMHGRPLADFMDDRGREITQRNLQRRRDGIAEPHEFTFRRKDGTELHASLLTNPIIENGVYAGALAMVSDIGERKRAEAQHRASEERFRSLFEHSPIVLWEEDGSELKAHLDALRAGGVTNFREYFTANPEQVPRCFALVKVLDVNQASLEQYEARDKAELIAGLARVSTPDSLGVLADELIALAEGQTVFQAETTDQTLNGRKNHILLKTLVAPGSEHTLSRMYVSIVDITERIKLEEQLRQSQKMDAVGHLAGGVAHDFNNLLTVIQGNTSLLQRGKAAPEQTAQLLDNIAKATDRAATLVRQLLTFSRQQVLQPREVDLNVVVMNLMKMLERMVGSDVQVRLDLCEQPLRTLADAGLLDQVLMNLVINARDAMPGGGSLVLETSVRTITTADTLAYPDLPAGDYACLRVSDSGIGIAPDHLARVFEPFFTTKEPGKGTGLGLATVFGIVKQHHGAVSVASTLGGGTTFTVVLPACAMIAR